VVFYHHLKLFSTDPEVVTGKKPLVNEYYDELVNILFLKYRNQNFSYRFFKNHRIF